MLGIQVHASWASIKSSKARKIKIHAVHGTNAYKDCRSKYCILHQKANDTKEDELRPCTNNEGMLRYSEESFQCKTDYLFCSKQVTLARKRTKQEQAHKVMTIKFKDALLEEFRDMMVGIIL